MPINKCTINANQKFSGHEDYAPEGDSWHPYYIPFGIEKTLTFLKTASWLNAFILKYFCTQFCKKHNSVRE